MANQPPYAPNTVNQTVDFGGVTWKGNPGTGWSQQGYTGQPSAPAATPPDPSGAQKDFLNDFSAAIKSQPTPTDIYSNLSTTLGLPATQQAYGSAVNQLNQIPNQTQQLATSMGGISSQQMAERNQVKSGEMAPLVSSLASTLGIKEQDLGTMFQGQMQQNQDKLLPFQTQAQFIGQNAQQAFQAWSQQDQQNFSQVMSKIQSDQQLSNEEALAAVNYANQLSMYQKYPQSVPNYNSNPYSLLSGSLGLGGTSGASSGGTTAGSW